MSLIDEEGEAVFCTPKSKDLCSRNAITTMPNAYNILTAEGFVMDNVENVKDTASILPHQTVFKRVTISQIANILKCGVAIARLRLEEAERKGFVCRDETPFSLYFFGTPSFFRP